MKTESLPGVTKVLEAMGEIELAVARLYRTCAERWPEERGFWTALEAQEHNHAQNLQRIAQLITQQTLAFEVQRPFDLVALHTIRTGVEELIRRVQEEDYSHSETLYVARDLEQSLVECKYGEFLKTTHREYQTLVKEIASQTYAHRDSLAKRIASLPGKPA